MENIGKFGRRVRVAVVDDDENTHLRFKGVLQSREGFIFAGGFSSGKEALTGIPCLRPDLAFLDIRLPDIDGIECAKRLRRFMPSLKVIILSGNRDIESFERSLDAGAVAYLIKPVDPDQLFVTLRFRSSQANAKLKERPISLKKAAMDTLNPREKAVLGKLAEGLLYKEIPDALDISYTAFRKSQQSIFRKLRVGNRSEAACIWLQN
jgi:DNA-binding NarL/FixJ family response regulator